MGRRCLRRRWTTVSGDEMIEERRRWTTVSGDEMFVLIFLSPINSIFGDIGVLVLCVPEQFNFWRN